MRKTRKVLDWEGFGWIPPYVTSTGESARGATYVELLSLF